MFIEYKYVCMQKYLDLCTVALTNTYVYDSIEYIIDIHNYGIEL